MQSKSAISKFVLAFKRCKHNVNGHINCHTHFTMQWMSTCKCPELLTSGPGFNPSAALSNKSFILATNVISLITVVPACLLILTWVKLPRLSMQSNAGNKTRQHHSANNKLQLVLPLTPTTHYYALLCQKYILTRLFVHNIIYPTVHKAKLGQAGESETS